MQPQHWLKTKKKNMEPTQTDTQNQPTDLFPFDQVTTSKKSRPIQGHLMIPFHIRSFTHFTQPEIFSIPMNETQNNGKLPTKSTEHTSMDFSLNKMKVPSGTESVNEQFYNPDQMLSLLSQVHKTPQKPQEKEKVPQIEENKESDDTSEINDRISIFTFAPILLEDKIEQFIEEKPQIKDKLGYINGQPTYIVEKLQKEAELIRTQNPLLHLKPEDFDLLNSSDVDYELYFAKRKDPFLKNYVDNKYEPQKEELRSQIKEEMTELMTIKQGKYLTNIIFSEVLEEILKIDQLEEELDQRIQKCQAKIKESQSRSSSQSISESSYDSVERFRIERNLNNEPKSARCYFDSSFQKQKIKQSEGKTYPITITSVLKSSDFAEIVFQSQIPSAEKNDKYSDVQPSDEGQERILSLLNQQIQSLQLKISEQEKTLNEQIQTQTELEMFCEKQQKESEEICNYKKFINEELHSLKSKFNQINEKINQDMNKISLQSKSLQGRIEGLTFSNQQKLKQLLQHLFDVLYIELQNLSNKLLKHSIDKKKWKANPQINPNQIEHNILNKFYEATIKSNLLQNYLQKSNFIQEIQTFSDKFTPLKLKSQDLLDFYSKMQKFLKVYLCVKIEEHRRTEDSKSKQDSSYVQNLYNLFDSNSYHSQNLKSVFFKFDSQFLSYGQRIFDIVYEELNQLQKDQEKRKELDSVLEQKDWMGFGRSSNVSTKRRSTKRKITKNDQKKFIDEVTSLLKDLNISHKQHESNQIFQFIKSMISAVND